MPEGEIAHAIKEHRFPCEACGADLRFDPAEGLLVCDHCGNRQEIGDAGTGQALHEHDLKSALARSGDDGQIEDIRYVTCPNCGARIEIEGPRHALECPFCATPIVADPGAGRRIRPHGLLPFALTERAARKAMTDWLGSLWFAPSGLREYARKGRRMQGIYVPYWTYDAATETRYTGQRGTIYHESRSVMRNGRRETVRVQKIRWRPVSGRVARFFDDVLVLASRSLPRRYTDALAPWDLADLEPYNPEYLAGFAAEGYTVALDEGFAEARDYMDRVIRRDVKFDIGGDRQRITSMKTDISDVTFKHVLLPVWLAAYKYRGRTYRFVVNGRSGRVRGERPWSIWKIALAVIAIAAIAGAIGWFAAMQQ